MKKKSAFRSAFHNPRVFIFCSSVVLAARRHLCVLLTSMLAVITTAACADQICFYVDKIDLQSLTGHCFVQMLPMGGPQAGRTDLVYGKHPTTWNVFTGNGLIDWDKSHRWDQKLCFNVTVAQYAAAADKINADLATPPGFRLIRNPPGNCVDWMSSVAAEAGITLPNKRWWFDIGTPTTFGGSLKAIGCGAMFGGGTISCNPNTNIGPDGMPVAAAMPNGYDAEFLASYVHVDPADTASFFNLPLSDTDLGAYTTTPAAGLNVTLTNVILDESLVSVNWGDDSIDVDAQQTAFTHSYGVTGTYAVTVAVINSGAIDFYRAQVTVSAGGPVANDVNINVPTPTPSTGTNPGFGPPPPPVLQSVGINISGTVLYCSNPLHGPVPNVTLTLTGDASGSTLSDGSGYYEHVDLANGGNYIVTPSKAALPPGSAGINTTDVIAAQRHFLAVALIPPGCGRDAADVTGDNRIDTSDVVAIQRFFLGQTFGFANVGKYQFTPANRSYPGVASDQTGQNYDALIFGDVASPFAQ